MPSGAEHDLGSVDGFEVEAIGERGQRRFRLRLTANGETASLWIEKEQVQALSNAIEQVLVQHRKEAEQRRPPVGGVVRLPASPDARFPGEPAGAGLRRRRGGAGDLCDGRRGRQPGPGDAAWVVLAGAGASVHAPGAGDGVGGAAAVPAVQGAAGARRSPVPAGERTFGRRACVAGPAGPLVGLGSLERGSLDWA